MWGISRGFVNPRWQPLFMQRSLGNSKSKMTAVVTTRIYGYFCTHVQDGGDERDKVFISILSTLIQINTSINLRYCFRKLNTCEEFIIDLTKKTLLTTEDVRMWLKHLDGVHKNRAEGAKKASAKKKSKSRKKGIFRSHLFKR